LWTDSYFGANSAVSSTNEYKLQTDVNSNRTIAAYVYDLADTIKVTWHINIRVSVKLASFTAQASPFNGIRLEWETTNEVENAGFNVLRSRSKDGEYKKLNDGLIRTRRDGRYGFDDAGITVGVQYYYMIEDVNIRGVASRHGPISAMIQPPTKLALHENYPNPFNPETNIRFELPYATLVTLIIYNSLGQEVRRLVDTQQIAGYHVVSWNGRDNKGHLVGSGIYFYRLVAGQFSDTKKMTLLR
jgi:hypothetical protein